MKPIHTLQRTEEKLMTLFIEQNAS